MNTAERVFIGYDSRELAAWEVCARSMVEHSSIPLCIQPVDQRALRHTGMFRRDWKWENGQYIDLRDHRPYSTEFAFTRFLVPALCQYAGRALFCDCDFLWRSDVAELFEMYDPAFAAQCVQHDHRPAEEFKMEGQAQGLYLRKNWSSLVLWNCGHRSNLQLTPFRVNAERGQFLHAFDWLEPAEIGPLPEAWNWLEGSSDPAIEPKAVHMTRGGPWLPNWQDVAYADEWRAYRC